MPYAVRFAYEGQVVSGKRLFCCKISGRENKELYTLCSEALCRSGALTKAAYLVRCRC